MDSLCKKQVGDTCTDTSVEIQNVVIYLPCINISYRSVKFSLRYLYHKEA